MASLAGTAARLREQDSALAAMRAEMAVAHRQMQELQLNCELLTKERDDAVAAVAQLRTTKTGVDPAVLPPHLPIVIL